MINSCTVATYDSVPFPFFSYLLKSCFSDLPLPLVDYFVAHWPPEKLTELARNKNSLIHSEDGGLIIGPPPEGGVATIFWLLVDPAHQKKGCGRRLLHEAVIHYESQGCHKLKVTAPSLAAVHYYEHNGFRTEGFHPAHWAKQDFWSLGKLIQNKGVFS